MLIDTILEGAKYILVRTIKKPGKIMVVEVRPLTLWSPDKVTMTAVLNLKKYTNHFLPEDPKCVFLLYVPCFIMIGIFG